MYIYKYHLTVIIKIIILELWKRKTDASLHYLSAPWFWTPPRICHLANSCLSLSLQLNCYVTLGLS